MCSIFRRAAVTTAGSDGSEAGKAPGWVAELGWTVELADAAGLREGIVGDAGHAASAATTTASPATTRSVPARRRVRGPGMWRESLPGASRWTAIAHPRHHPAMRRGIWLTGVLVGALLSTCSGGGGGVGRPVPDAVVPAPFSRPRPPADAATVRLLSLPGTLVAAPLVPSIDVHAAPGTEEPYMDLGSTNPWRQRLRLLVVRDALDDDGDIWLRVQLPIWPNGQEGWVPASEVNLSKTTERIVVDLSRRMLIRRRDGAIVARLPVAVGKPSTPTPPGHYVVWARVATGRPSGPYGSYIIGLSGFSESIQPSDWPGEPRLAIHGTDDPSDPGQAVSSGCIRVLNGLLRRLEDVPMGTPVVIRD
jgi:lipoprotein-anchoring transpeptidase ErfK/SrfK